MNLLKYGLKICWDNGKHQVILLFFIRLLSGFIIPVNLWLIKNLMDTGLSIIEGGGKIFPLCLFLGGVLIVQLFSSIQKDIASFITMRLTHKLKSTFCRDILKRCGRIEYYNFEFAETYDLIGRVTDQSENKVVMTLTSVFGIMSYSISILGILFFVIQSGWWIFLLILFISLPVWFLTVRATLKERNTWVDVFSRVRKSFYLSELIKGREFAKETRLFNSGDYLNEKWSAEFDSFSNAMLKIAGKSRIGTGLFTFLQGITLGLIIFILIYPLEKGTLTIGAFIAVIEAVRNLIGSFAWEFSGLINNLSAVIFYWKDYLDFLDQERNVRTKKKNEKKLTVKKVDSIELRDIWFKYPGSNEYILKGVSFKINAGEKVAIVGENGAGKTTLLKLFLGLYIPEKGKMFVNGRDISHLGIQDRSPLFSVVFQDYCKYNLTLAENIGIGNINHYNDMERISGVAEKSGVNDFIPSLAEGYNSFLGKLKQGGIDLSGGQWQRVAISRCLMSENSVLVLDEPTASLDPVAEVEVFNSFNAIVKNKTGIYITHRLGSVKIADTILVLADGIIKERGPHEELIGLHGIYQEMYNSQEQWYRKEK